MQQDNSSENLSISEQTKITSDRAKSAEEESESSQKKATSAQTMAKQVQKETEALKAEQYPNSKTPPKLQNTMNKAEFALEESGEAIAIAQSARLKAESARNNAEYVRSMAENARNISEFSRKNAETEREAASKLTREALKAKETAELALKEAAKAKDKAELAEERYKLVIEGSNDGLWDWDIKKGTVYWNGRFFNMLGFTTTPLESKVNETFFDRIHPEDKERLYKTIERALSSNQHFQEQFRIKHIQGHYIYCCSRGKALTDQTGKPVRMAGTITDITERIHLQTELEKAKKDAELSNQRKTQALANMSHELKTPLNAVVGYSGMLLQGSEESLTEKQERYIHNIAVSGQHLLEMINDILDLTKIEAGKIPLTLEWIDLPSLIKDVHMMVQESAAQKQITLTFDIPNDIDGPEADPARLRQILLNLLSNAIKYNRNGGQVYLRIRKTDDRQWIVFTVKDTGIGIRKDNLDNLFTEFYQIDSSTAGQQKGTGLGLALTRRLVELHGGNISVESEEEVGSTFTFRLPIGHH